MIDEIYDNARVVAPPPPQGSTSIDGGGRVLMPGLTDADWHMVFAPNTMQDLSTADTGLMYAKAVAEARRTLMRGFTTVRDTGGPTFGLQAAIDAGDIPGPRFYPSGALISQTGGPGDFSPAYAPPLAIGGQPGHYEEIGAFAVANGVPEVLAAVRDQLKKGASQIKLALGGGVISDSDPIDTLQFTPEEIRAAVQASTTGALTSPSTSMRQQVYGEPSMPASIRSSTGTWPTRRRSGSSARRARG